VPPVHFGLAGSTVRYFGIEVDDAPCGVRNAHTKSLQAYGDGVKRPLLHWVDGGVADSVGMRSVLDAMEVLEALRDTASRSAVSINCLA
jgi:hypothetical protein